MWGKIGIFKIFLWQIPPLWTGIDTIYKGKRWDTYKEKCKQVNNITMQHYYIITSKLVNIITKENYYGLFTS